MAELGVGRGETQSKSSQKCLWPRVYHGSDPRDDFSTVHATCSPTPPHRPYDTSDDFDPPLDPAWEELTAGVLQVVRIRTFQVIVAQGVVGQIPWIAMLFFTLWLELLGFSHKRAASLVRGREYIREGGGEGEGE